MGASFLYRISRDASRSGPPDPVELLETGCGDRTLRPVRGNISGDRFIINHIGEGQRMPVRMQSVNLPVEGHRFKSDPSQCLISYGDLMGDDHSLEHDVVSWRVSCG